MSAVAILERLLDDQAQTSSKEHVLETASHHVSNVETRFAATFDQVVHEISAIWGEPQFNSSVQIGGADEEEEPEPEPASDSAEPGTETSAKRKKLRNVVPPWSNGTARSGGKSQALRLSYWKRPSGVSYVVLRTELNKEKGFPMSYDLVLGSRRRGPEAGRDVSKLKGAKGHWFTPVLNWLVGR